MAYEMPLVGASTASVQISFAQLVADQIADSPPRVRSVQSRVEHHLVRHTTLIEANAALEDEGPTDELAGKGVQAHEMLRIALGEEYVDDPVVL